MKKCKICKQPFIPKHSTLEKTCRQYDCMVEFALQIAKDPKNKVNAEKLEKRDWLERKKSSKEKLKTLSQYEAEAKKSFQKWVRKRDEGLPCISCGTLETMRWDGGHLFKAEIFSGVIFDERNTNRQCIKCNTVLNGNEAEYSIRLKERIGTVEFLKLQIKAMETRYYKYTKEELIEIKNKYDKLTK